jgi:hypothetical protein
MDKKVKRSKTGLPTIAESGGSATNTGGCQVVCGSHGEPLKPLYTPKRGYAQGEHAIFVARVGMHIIEQSHTRDSECVVAWRIAGIGNSDDPDALELEKVAEWENGDGDIPDFLQPAAYAASEKGYCYHCREPHYVS